MENETLSKNTADNYKLKIKKDPVHKNIMQIEATLINEDSFVPDDASSISGGNIFIYSCSTQLISFKIESISKEIICAEHEYMNLLPPPSLLSDETISPAVHKRKFPLKSF